MGWAGKKAFWVKALAAESDNLCSVPGGMGRQLPPSCLLTSTRASWCVLNPTCYIHTHTCMRTHGDRHTL